MHYPGAQAAGRRILLLSRIAKRERYSAEVQNQVVTEHSGNPDLQSSVVQAAFHLSLGTTVGKHHHAAAVGFSAREHDRSLDRAPYVAKYDAPALHEPWSMSHAQYMPLRES